MQTERIYFKGIAATFFIVILLAGCAAQKPGVRDGDPAESYFSNQVVYPYRVEYQEAAADDGTTWNIGYMDVRPLFKLDPKVLVLIHGRAFGGAYFGHAIRMASKHGIRVVVPDLPNCGKSIPGNLDKSLARSMQHAREVIHDLVVNRLKIAKATYGGHSMGGQFVLGYALTYPEAVERIILVAPAGLEELPAKFYPSSLAKSTDRADFDKIPYYAGMARLAYSTNAKRIEDFFYYRLEVNGKILPMGFFKKETPDTRLATDIRTSMITGNPGEFERYSIASLRDVYHLGVEIQKEDPDSLFKRYDRIRAPIFLIFGDDDPFFPKKISGLKDLNKEMIKPFYEKMTAAGCPVAVKLYPGCGHFPHSDLPELFAEDVMRFVSSREVQNTVDPSIF